MQDCRKHTIFDSDRYKLKFVGTLDDLRTELGFKIIGYILIRRLTDDRIRHGADYSRRGEAAPRPYYGKDAGPPADGLSCAANFSSSDGPADLK